MKEYISASGYCKKIFGQKVYKLALSAATTCPNRDGTKGVGGCAFCSVGGSGDFAADGNAPIKKQIDEAKNILGAKAEGVKFIAYFQSFTGTYGDIDKLERIYNEALSCTDIVGLSIATRPDCLSDKSVEMLSRLSKKTVLWIELGLQTANEKTAKHMNRCYDNIEYEIAVKKLRTINVHIITHIILGLPGETKADMLDTVKYISDKTDGVKLQLLHILKNTALADIYEHGEFETMQMNEYCETVAECIELLSDNTVIHRLTGDGPKSDLIAPLWSKDKKRVLGALQKVFKEHGINKAKE